MGSNTGIVDGKPFDDRLLQRQGTDYRRQQMADVQPERPACRIGQLPASQDGLHQICHPHTQKIHVGAANVRLEGNNLWTVCSKKLNGQDPEQLGMGNIGITTPPVSSFSFGLDITF